MSPHPPVCPVGKDGAILRDDSHPLLKNIRETIAKFQSQSEAHQALDITAFSVYTIEDFGLSPNTKLLIRFDQNCGLSYQIDCLPKCINKRIPRKKKAAGQKKLSDENKAPEKRVTDKVICLEKGYRQSLEKFLAATFPVEEGLCVPVEVEVSKWWASNGMSFNWEGLPVELKTKILGFCTDDASYRWSLLGARHRTMRDSARGNVVGAHEIIDRLGNWQYLLRVDRQTRAIILREFFTPNECTKRDGLGLVYQDLAEFRASWHRLGSHYQVRELGKKCIPTNAKEEKLARKYANEPKLYPELSRFATMRQGIGGVGLVLDWDEAFEFFKVPIATSRRGKPFTCDRLQALSGLNRVIIHLPWEWPPRDNGWSCTRSLHRYIYEAAARELAPYSVTMTRFMDDDEADQFRELHAYYADLNSDGDGGVSLLEPPKLTATSRNRKKKGRYNARPPNPNNRIIPQECKCEISCEFVWDDPFCWRTRTCVDTSDHKVRRIDDLPQEQ